MSSPAITKTISAPSRYVSASRNPGMAMWLTHRITGVLILLFLLAHLVDFTALAYNPHMTIKELSTLFLGIPNIVLNGIFLAVVLFHGLNGMRVIAIDLFPVLSRHHRTVIWLTVAVSIVSIVVAEYIMMQFVYSIASAAGVPPF